MPIFVLLLVMLLAELAVIIAIGHAIGALVTILLLVAVSVAGVALLRRQGTRTVSSFLDAVRNRRDPQPEMIDGMLLGAAGVLVVFPGFVSDVLALLLLFPPTRGIVRRRILRRAARRPARPFVVDAEVVRDRPAEPIIIDAVREDRD